MNTINQYTPDFSKKKNATLKLYDVVDAQEAIINAFPDATEDEKQDAINKVEALLLDAKSKLHMLRTINKLMTFIMKLQIKSKRFYLM